MSHERFSRRAFLKTAAAGAGLLTLAACAPAGVSPTESGSSASEEPITLRLHMRAGGETGEVPIYVTRPNEFTEETGIQVQLEPIPGGEYWPKIETLAASNTLGDNMFTDEKHWQHSRAVHFGLIQEIDDFMESEGISHDEWLPGVIDTCMIDGKTYGLPKTAHPAHAYVWINHNLFEEAGIEIPETYGTTWEQYAEWANTLAQGDPERREVYGFHMPTENIQMFINGIRTFGGWVIDEEGVEALADSDGWRDFITYAHNMYQVDRVMPHSSELGSAGVTGLFAAGKLAMMVASRGTNKSVREAVGPEDGSGEFPWSVLGLAEGPNFNGWGLSLNTHTGTTQSEHKHESFLLTYALSDARFTELVANEIGYLVGRTNELEEIGPAADDSFIQLQFNQQSNGVAYRIGANYRGLEYGSTIANMCDEVFLGQRDPDDAFFNDLDGALDEVLDRSI